MPTESPARAVPRTAVRVWLHAVRLPLTAIEAIGHRRPNQDESWLPALLFDDVAARVESVAGSVLRDPKMIDEAHVARERVRKIRRAQTLDAAAEERRDLAAEELTERRSNAEERREDAQRRRDQAEAAAEAALERREEAAARRASEKKAKADELEDQVKERAEAKAKKARVEQLPKEQRAISEARQALAAEEKVSKVDADLKKTKARRKAG
jgi:hypothetical protein